MVIQFITTSCIFFIVSPIGGVTWVHSYCSSHTGHSLKDVIPPTYRKKAEPRFIQQLPHVSTTSYPIEKTSSFILIFIHADVQNCMQAFFYSLHPEGMELYEVKLTNISNGHVKTTK